MATTPITQRDTRDEGVFTDQFERPYLVVWEKKTMAPTGLRTPQKYLSIPQTKYGMQAIGTLYCDLKQFAADQAQALKDWTLNLWNVAELEYPSQKPTPREMESDPLLLRRAGPKPWPSADVIRVAMKGVEDRIARQLLGLDPLGAEAKLMVGAPTGDAVDTYVEEKMEADDAPRNWREFVSWAIRTGKAETLKDCAPLWEAVKAQRKTA